MRDVVGFLEAVSSDPNPRWSIRERTGEVVAVDVASVVSATTVPDTPLRLRTASDIDAVALEKIAAEAWQPLESEQLGAWVLRAASGFTGRANSVLPLGDPGVPVDQALAIVASWYRVRSLTPKIQVPLPLLHDLDAALQDAGWQPRQRTVVMVADIAALQLSTANLSRPSTAMTLKVADQPSAQWLAAFRDGTSPVPPEVVPIMTKAEQPVFLSIYGTTAELVGIARGVVRGQWLGITAVEVSEARRRQGIATALMTTLAEHATLHRCRHAWLQVASDNTPARTLYDRLGFSEHHHYIYRQLDTARR